MIYAALSEDHRTIEAVYAAPAPTLPDPGPDHGIPAELADEHARLGDRLVVLSCEERECPDCLGCQQRTIVRRRSPAGVPLETARIDCPGCHGTGTLPPENLVGSPVVVDDEGVVRVVEIVAMGDRFFWRLLPTREVPRYTPLAPFFGCPSQQSAIESARKVCSPHPQPLGVDPSAAAPSEGK